MPDASPRSPTPPTRSDRIVVGVDGSEPSKRALTWGRIMAEALGYSVEAVAAWHVPAVASPSAGWVPLPTDQHLVEDTDTMLHATLAQVFSDHPPSELRATVRQGNAAKVLLDASAGARMLIVGSRGHGGFAGLLLGSVSAACAEHATCPVLIVHEATPPLPSSEVVAQSSRAFKKV